MILPARLLLIGMILTSVVLAGCLGNRVTLVDVRLKNDTDHSLRVFFSMNATVGTSHQRITTTVAAHATNKLFPMDTLREYSFDVDITGYPHFHEQRALAKGQPATLEINATAMSLLLG